MKLAIGLLVLAVLLGVIEIENDLDEYHAAVVAACTGAQP